MDLGPSPGSWTVVPWFNRVGSYIPEISAKMLEIIAFKSIEINETSNFSQVIPYDFASHSSILMASGLMKKRQLSNFSVLHEIYRTVFCGRNDKF